VKWPRTALVLLLALAAALVTAGPAAARAM
jgi:hypothetical protein